MSISIWSKSTACVTDICPTLVESALGYVTLAVLRAIAESCVVCCPCIVVISEAFVAIPLMFWSQLFVQLVFHITIA